MLNFYKLGKSGYWGCEARERCLKRLNNFSLYGFDVLWILSWVKYLEMSLFLEKNFQVLT